MTSVDCFSRIAGHPDCYSVNGVTNLSELECVKVVQSQNKKFRSIIDMLRTERSLVNKDYFDNFEFKSTL